MASAGTNGALPQDFNLYLTPQQQNLLFAALNSNTPVENGTGPDQSRGESSGPNRPSSLHESPFLDNNYDFFLAGDTSFDLDSGIDDSQVKMIDDIPQLTGSKAATEAETHDKRSHPDDEDDDGNNGGNSPKRRESGTEKVPKKPGRKPLMEEPTSKRKAQNRAAQRAFRERKEKHLKDLETKVEELEKVSQDANHENSVLRTQIERMTSELNEYKQRLSLINTSKALSRDKGSPHSFGAAAISNLGHVNFQFEFPKFGVLPGPPMPSAMPKSPTPVSPLQQQPREGRASSQGAADAVRSIARALSHENMTNLASASPVTVADTLKNGSRGSIDSAPSLAAAATSSPSASSTSNMGSSSCGTSPEPFTQSPMGFKPLDTMSTIGEEHPGLTGVQTFDDFAAFNPTGFDWLSQQNGGQFDPQLFREYRDTSDAGLGKNFFDDSYFNETLDADFSTPFFTPPAPIHIEKKSLIAEIDAKKNADDEIKVDDGGNGFSCHKIWERLQNCDKVQSGEVDMDSLCKELQQKATCKGNGPEVHEKDFDKIMKKYIPGCEVEDEKWKAARVPGPAAQGA